MSTDAFYPASNPTLYGVQFFPVGPFIHHSLAVKLLWILFALTNYSSIFQEYVSQLNLSARIGISVFLAHISDVA
jgi:hypothetical protein